MHPPCSQAPSAYPDVVSDSGESENPFDRIESFTPNSQITINPLATGSLAELVTWWQQRGTVLTPHRLEPTAGGFGSGSAAVDAAVDTGATLLYFTSDMQADPVVTRAIIGLLTRKDAWQVTHQGLGTSDQQAMDQITAIVDLMRENRESRAQPRELALLDSTGVIAFYLDALLEAAVRKTPVILGSTQELAAALIGHRISMKASHWWRNAATSPDRAVGQAVERMGISSGLPLDLSDDRGVGAQISVDLLQSFTSASPQ